MSHPGCVHGGPERNRYSDKYRRFTLDLRTRHGDIPLPAFADAIHVPLGTIEDWLANAPVAKTSDSPESSDGPETTDGAERPSPIVDPAAVAQTATILAEWSRWEGGFSTFCKHLEKDLRLDLGRQFVADLLETEGVRLRKRRRGRLPDEKALRQAFETAFPGAQWVGDGTQYEIQLNGETFRFNIELHVDAKTGAFVGVSIRDEEDSEAVIESLRDGIATTGAAPVAELLDNRSSNLTPEVEDELKKTDTILIQATPGRPQNKAHVEGAFGLFKQTIPNPVIDASTPRALAIQIIALIVMTWGRTLNNKKRSDRGGKTRVELYREGRPSEDEIKEARAMLAERARKQKLAQQTREARLDPVIRELVAKEFDRLGLLDPTGNTRAAIAGFPRNAIVNGIATYSAKERSGTLPADIDDPARYLLGIVRNVAQDEEAKQIADELMRLRTEARDLALKNLTEDRGALLSEGIPIEAKVKLLLDRVTDATRVIDRLFWIDSVAELIGSAELCERKILFQSATRQIQAVYHIPYRDRLAAARTIANKVVLIE
jgi:transposase InsO family protein